MLISGFRRLISPRACLFCGQGENYLCHACFCKNLVQPQLLLLANTPTLVMSRYHDLVREIIVRHKDHHFVAVRKYLSHSLAIGIELMNLDKNCQIISIPTSKKAVRQRLDDPVKYMVSQAAANAGLNFNSQVLSMTREKVDQVGLNLLQRRRNTAGIFQAKPGKATVAVLDDVTTSGATLIAANHALRVAGYEVVANICVANTPKTLQS
jgi:predicted amidophosphoribosyltransferase